MFLSLFACILCVPGGLAAYDYGQRSYQPTKYHTTSYQTYDKRALKDENIGKSYAYPQPSYQQPPRTSSYSAVKEGTVAKTYQYPPTSHTSSYGSAYPDRGTYGWKNRLANDGYGYQTRNTFIQNNKYHLPTPSDHTQYGQYGGPSSRSSYYKQADPSYSYHYTPYGEKKEYAYEPTKARVVDYSGQDYAPKAYDPCHELPEGDYALQAEFTSVFPGVDAQCNFVKCANYKAYVNPCSIGTKNDEYGDPHAKKGFCANRDYNHYCGLYPPGPRDNYE